MEEKHNSLSYFSAFVETCEAIRLTPSKNNKTDLIANYISNLQNDSLSIAILFLSGKIFPSGSSFHLNIGFRTILQSLLEISNLNDRDIKRIHLEHGDMGAMAEIATSKKKVTTLFDQLETKVEEKLTIKDIYGQFKKIAALAGPKSNTDKKNHLKGLLVKCTPLESKYLVKIITGEMRIGSHEGLVELAIAKAFGKDVKSVREAMLISGNIANVALLAKSNSLNNVTVEPFVPMGFMLADVMFTAEEILGFYEKPLICEYKYDGIRVQIHKFKNKCKLFSRNLADISYAFPELVDSAINAGIAKEEWHNNNESQCDHKCDEKGNDQVNIDFILDGELIAFKNNRPMRFQELQKRLRKKNITRAGLDEIPIRYIAYDIMFFNEKLVINETLELRKKIMSKFLFASPIMINSKSDIITTSEEIRSNFKKSRENGHEGLVIKDPLSQYHPGKRGKHWIKLKEELDTIDTVIVMAEYGHGKRAGTLSDYTLAVKESAETNIEIPGAKNFDPPLDNLQIIGKAYSGLTNKEIEQMTSKLKSLCIKDEGSRIIVKPEIVLEVSFDTIQKSDRHGTGFALRFPRIKNIRHDKGPKDIDSMEKIKMIYENQIHIKNNMWEKKQFSSKHEITTL
jgi:DNA ligase-1